MKRFKNHIKQRQSFRYSYIILICILLTSIIFISFETNAEQKEFQLKSYDQKLQFQKNGIKSIDINYREGEKLEFVFNIQVKDNLPIDIWFVNEDNYLLLSNGAQFLFYIDGSGSQLSYAKRIVTLTEHDNYKLVMTNYYANQSIQLDISYELCLKSLLKHLANIAHPSFNASSNVMLTSKFINLVSKKLQYFKSF